MSFRSLSAEAPLWAHCSQHCTETDCRSRGLRPTLWIKADTWRIALRLHEHGFAVRGTLVAPQHDFGHHTLRHAEDLHFRRAAAVLQHVERTGLFGVVGANVSKARFPLMGAAPTNASARSCRSAARRQQANVADECMDVELRSQRTAFDGVDRRHCRLGEVGQTCQIHLKGALSTPNSCRFAKRECSEPRPRELSAPRAECINEARVSG